MAHYPIPEPQIQTLPIVGSEEVFPVRRVYCIGRNYAAHAVEMGHDPTKEDPFFFQKNPDNLNLTGNFPYPPKSSDVHHEAEVLVALKSGGTDIQYSDAMSHVFGYALCLDMTRRDRQGEMKKAGRPWEIGKAFEHSAPCGPIHRVADIGHPTEGEITLTINGEVRQRGDLNQMIWKIPDMIAYLSSFYELAPGDVILSGTPSGVGPVKKGDVMRVALDPLGHLEVTVT